MFLFPSKSISTLMATFSPHSLSTKRTMGSAFDASQATLARSSSRALGARRASSHMAQFQKKGSVPKRALTPAGAGAEVCGRGMWVLAVDRCCAGVTIEQLAGAPCTPHAMVGCALMQQCHPQPCALVVHVTEPAAPVAAGAASAAAIHVCVLLPTWHVEVLACRVHLWQVVQVRALAPDSCKGGGGTAGGSQRSGRAS